MKNSVQSISLITGLAILVALTGCASHAERDYRAEEQFVGLPALHTVAQVCAANLGSEADPDYVELDSSNLEIFNWNIRKGADPRWTADLYSLSDAPDLMLFQEVALQSDDWNVLATGLHASFAPGYRTRRSLTGVMTISAARPLTQCTLVSVEPWLGSPKATMITEYGLTDTDDSLLVINIHAVNFTIGIQQFSEQVGEIAAIVQAHSGPVLVSGDFNTWRAGRAAVVSEAVARLGLFKLEFTEDHRKRVFGQPLDHMYVRGLEVLSATTHDVRTSDHNPMSVLLRL